MPRVTAVVVLLVLTACGQVLATASGERATTTLATTMATTAPSTPVTSRPTTTVRPATTTTTDPPRGELLIHGVGDVVVDPAYVYGLAVNGYDDALSGLGTLFVDDDLTVANLECPASDLPGPAADKEFNFRCDPAGLAALAAGGVDVANQANNHFLDFGWEVAADSLVQIARAGLHPVGVGESPDAAYAPALLDIDGWRVAVLGFGGVILGPEWLVSDEQPGMANGDDLDAMVAAVAAAAEQADLVVVTVHWGWERELVPQEGDVERAAAMAAAGADVIFGHHQHRLQPMSRIGDAIVFWGLGNFVWPTISPESSRTAVAEVRVGPDGQIAAACLIPATIVRSGHPELDAAYSGCEGIDSPLYDVETGQIALGRVGGG